MSKSILVVDDDPDVTELVAYNLSRAGYQVLTAATGEIGLRLARKEQPAVVLLDVTLPGRDGFEIASDLRRDLSVPIIFLTARDAEVDKVVGLELGADDYVTKPFSPRELLARIKAVLRRTSTPARGGRLGANGVEIDPAGHRAYRDGAPLELTAKEFALLECFLRHPGVALTRQTILDQVWGFDYYGDLRTVDVHVQRLRKKIEPDPPRPRIVTTVPGLGYRLEAGSDAAEDS